MNGLVYQRKNRKKMNANAAKQKEFVSAPPFSSKPHNDSRASKIPQVPTNQPRKMSSSSNPALKQQP